MWQERPHCEKLQSRTKKFSADTAEISFNNASGESSFTGLLETGNTYDTCFYSVISGNESQQAESIRNNEIFFKVDSGATDHLVNSRSYFWKSIKLRRPIDIRIAKSGDTIKATEIGIIKYVHKNRIHTISNVLFSSEARCNLLSVNRSVTDTNCNFFLQKKWSRYIQLERKETSE